MPKRSTNVSNGKSAVKIKRKCSRTSVGIRTVFSISNTVVFLKTHFDFWIFTLYWHYFKRSTYTTKLSSISFDLYLCDDFNIRSNPKWVKDLEYLRLMLRLKAIIVIHLILKRLLSFFFLLFGSWESSK